MYDDQHPMKLLVWRFNAMNDGLEVWWMEDEVTRQAPQVKLKVIRVPERFKHEHTYTQEGAMRAETEDWYYRLDPCQWPRRYGTFPWHAREENPVPFLEWKFQFLVDEIANGAEEEAWAEHWRRLSAREVEADAWLEHYRLLIEEGNDRLRRAQEYYERTDPL